MNAAIAHSGAAVFAARDSETIARPRIALDRSKKPFATDAHASRELRPNGAHSSLDIVRVSIRIYLRQFAFLTSHGLRRLISIRRIRSFPRFALAGELFFGPAAKARLWLSEAKRRGFFIRGRTTNTQGLARLNCAGQRTPNP
jgi:hypothetical protein